MRLMLGFGILATSLAAHATIIEGLSVEELTLRSDHIARGQIVDQKTRWDDGHTRIYTDVTIAVAETYKGSARPTVTVRRLGGTVDGIGMRTFGEAEFAAGEEVFVFLRRGSSSIYQTVGMAQGKLRIVRDGSQPRVLFDTRSAALLLHKADGRSQIAKGTQELRPLEDLENQVRALVRGSH